MKLKRLSLLFLLGLLMGCASVRSNSKHDAIPTFSRILVVSKLQNVSDRYVFEYLNAFPNRLYKDGIIVGKMPTNSVGANQ